MEGELSWEGSCGLEKTLAKLGNFLFRLRFNELPRHVSGDRTTRCFASLVWKYQYTQNFNCMESLKWVWKRRLIWIPMLITETNYSLNWAGPFSSVWRAGKDPEFRYEFPSRPIDDLSRPLQPISKLLRLLYLSSLLFVPGPEAKTAFAFLGLYRDYVGLVEVGTGAVKQIRKIEPACSLWCWR